MTPVTQPTLNYRPRFLEREPSSLEKMNARKTGLPDYGALSSGHVLVHREPLKRTLHFCYWGSTLFYDVSQARLTSLFLGLSCRLSAELFLYYLHRFIEFKLALPVIHTS